MDEISRKSGNVRRGQTSALYTRSLTDLPSETLSEIFEVGYCGPEESWSLKRSEIWSRSSYRNFCLAISWTCSRLRTVITNTPKCWSNVYVAIRDSDLGVEKWELVALFLRRSKPLLYDLILQVDGWDGPADELLPLQVMLREHASRCRSVSFEQPETPQEFWSFDPTLLAGAEYSSLQVLHFSRDGGEPPSPDAFWDLQTAVLEPQLSLLQVASARITSLYLSRPLGMIYNLVLPAFSFASLKRLHIEASLHMHSMPQILFDCPVLEYLSWWQDSGDEGFDEASDLTADTAQPLISEPLFLPHLLSLRLFDLGPLRKFPSVLIAPALQSVVLDDRSGGFGSEDPPPSFILNPASSFPALRQFTASTMCSTKEVVNALLSRCPSLEEISVKTHARLRASGHPETMLRAICASTKSLRSLSSGHDTSQNALCFELFTDGGYSNTAGSKIQDVIITTRLVEETLLAVPGLQIRLVNVAEPGSNDHAENERLRALRDENRLVFTRRSNWYDDQGVWAAWNRMCSDYDH